MKPNVLICIPTLRSRRAYLANCLYGYQTRTPQANLSFTIVYDQPSCGRGWNLCAERGLRQYPGTDFIHFANDDIVVAGGWVVPLIEAVARGFVPVSRMEPAGHYLGEFPAEDPPMPPLEARRSGHGYFYSDLPEKQPQNDWDPVDHGSLPFCSLDQWRRIGPFIPIHFGTDKWFFERAALHAYKAVARQGSVVYNYAAQAGRSKGDWYEIDYLDFDLTVAYPMYVSGELRPSDEHPLRDTAEGLQLVREWRRRSFPGPHHWEG